MADISVSSLLKFPLCLINFRETSADKGSPYGENDLYEQLISPILARNAKVPHFSKTLYSGDAQSYNAFIIVTSSMEQEIGNTPLLVLDLYSSTILKSKSKVIVLSASPDSLLFWIIDSVLISPFFPIALTLL